MRRTALLIASILLLSAPVAGDDLRIFGANTTPEPPNILIIFDNSRSMDTLDIPGNDWDPDVTWPGTFNTNQVYYFTSGNFWEPWEYRPLMELDHINRPEFLCTSARSALLADGIWTGFLDCEGPLYNCTAITCANTFFSTQFATGNYLNWKFTDGGEHYSRLSVAKLAISSVIQNTMDVRFGLMVFDRSWEGGNLLHEVGSDPPDILNSIDTITADTRGTPLTEVMLDAGLYFAGRSAMFDDNNQTGAQTPTRDYTSPIQSTCQPNNIILVTDGEPTGDAGAGRYTTFNYIHGEPLLDPDGQRPRVDDVGRWLFENDVRPDLGTGTLFETQNVRTYAIGFVENPAVLQVTARDGGGRYFTASNALELANSLQQTIQTIADQAASILAVPAVPVSESNRLFSSDAIYISLFRARDTGLWPGNLKKYRLGANNQILGSDNLPAVDSDGAFIESARSFWSIINDGTTVNAGGAGQQLADRIAQGTARNLYTHVDDTESSLTASENAFSSANTTLLAAPYSLGAQDIDDVHGDPNVWPMQDVVHFSPVAVHYPDPANKTLVFVGTNGGILHAFDDADGSELWGFVPRDQVAKLQGFRNQSHGYYVDGHTGLHMTDSQKLLLFGSRRGGRRYTSLDITTHDAPSHQFTFPSDPSPSGSEGYGYAFSNPRKVTIQTGASSTNEVYVIGGGVDPAFDVDPAPQTNSVGRLITAFDVVTGAAESSFHFSADTAANGFTNSFIDVVPHDLDVNGIVDRFFAVDLGGNLFALRDDATSDGSLDGAWTVHKVFTPPAGKAAFHSPDIALDRNGKTLVYFGTGDRSRPLQDSIVNRFYAIRTDWSSTTALTESADDTGIPASEDNSDEPNLDRLLIDVTEDKLNSASSISLRNRYRQALLERATNRGWYITLEDQGEKMASSPVVFAGVVYFTTYTPPASSSSEDACVSRGLGTARLYAVDFDTGSPAFDFDSAQNSLPLQDEDGNYLDADGNIVATAAEAATFSSLHKKDRFKTIGQGLPSAPTVAINRNGPVLLIGVGGGILAQQTNNERSETESFYWRLTNN